MTNPPIRSTELPPPALGPASAKALPGVDRTRRVNTRNATKRGIFAAHFRGGFTSQRHTPASASRPTASWWPSAAFPPLSSASPRDGSRHLRYPEASSRAVPARLERHVPHSIASIRRRLTVDLIRALPRCPCCLRKQHTRAKRL